MDGRTTRPSAIYKLTVADDGGAVDVVLGVDIDPAQIEKLPKSIIKPGAKVELTQYENLDQVTLTGPEAPDLVLSPLLTPSFDALDLARYLTQRMFAGRYLALVDRLPSAGLIRREVAAQSPMLNFDVIVLDGSNPMHSV